MAYSARLEELVAEPNGILAGVSGQRAQLRVAKRGGTITGATILKMKQGIFGEDASLRQLAVGYAPEFWGRHRGEILAFAGDPDNEPGTPEEVASVVADWFVYEVVTDAAGVSRPIRPRNPDPPVEDEAASDPTPAGDSPTPDAGLLEQAAAAGARKAIEELRAQGLLVSNARGAYVAAAMESYDEAYQRRYHAMGARLREDGYSVVPPPASHEGGSEGLTAEDAEREVAELERVFRKNFKPDRGKG